MSQEDVLDAKFWNHLWKSNLTGWDIGKASPPITAYLDQYDNKDAAILIPGCGNAYEAEYMLENDFTNITLVDISEEAVLRLKKKFKGINQIDILHKDFFKHKGTYDLIVEQTFFSALPPKVRSSYAQQVASLLKKGGRLVGVLFDQEFDQEGPPFGGLKEDYRIIFEPYFTIYKMERCYNSIPPRAGGEAFINLIKK